VIVDHIAPEAVRNVAAAECERLTGKPSASKYVFLATVVLLGAEGHNFRDIIRGLERREINELRRRMSARV